MTSCSSRFCVSDRTTFAPHTAARTLLPPSASGEAQQAHSRRRSQSLLVQRTSKRAHMQQQAVAAGPAMNGATGKGTMCLLLSISTLLLNTCPPDRRAVVLAAPVAERQGSVQRRTKETCVDVSIGLDGTGVCSSESGIPFLDHMMDVRFRNWRVSLVRLRDMLHSHWVDTLCWRRC